MNNVTIAILAANALIDLINRGFLNKEKTQRLLDAAHAEGRLIGLDDLRTAVSEAEQAQLDFWAGTWNQGGNA